MSFWECGYYRLQNLSLYRLAQVFGVRMDKLEIRRLVERETGTPVDQADVADSVPQSQQSTEIGVA